MRDSKYAVSVNSPSSTVGEIKKGTLMNWFRNRRVLTKLMISFVGVATVYSAIFLTLLTGESGTKVYVSLGIAFLMSAMLGLCISRMLCKQLEEIDYSLKLFEGGNLDQEIPIRSRDEIGHVAKSINHIIRETKETHKHTKGMLSEANVMSQMIELLGSSTNHSQAVQGAMDLIRQGFGLAYGSYWRVDPIDKALKFLSESGSVNEEFRRVTLEGKFREGQGLNGRAWQQRSLYSVKDISEVTDCVRVPSAKAAGVKSAVAFPIIVANQVYGTMDFFSTDDLPLSEERIKSLANVGKLVSATIERFEAARTQNMVDSMKFNIMFADPDHKIRYANPASMETLRKIEQLLPIKVDNLIGQSIDIFHRNPKHQHDLINKAKTTRPPAVITLGGEHLELNVSPVFNTNQERLGTMVTWSLITEKLSMESKIKEASEFEANQNAELRRKVDTIISVVDQMAAGNFLAEVPHLGEDSVGQMGFALNKAIIKVREALEGVRQVSEQVADAAVQLASASDEISTGAQQQASSLEETASTLEEITATVKQNSDSAQQARQLAQGSSDVAQKGGSVVSNAVQAMEMINSSSNKIVDIISAIDEIAFQTNLLALNAAVEAARAGEQGRGFAVVASEVRNLAQRSASAAKEIKGLIQDSVKKVDMGTDLVNRSGSTLNEIVTSVKRVTDIVNEIAAASQEQATGIEQVNKAVLQMDEVTQRNATQTEEMSATAQTLTDHATHLRQLVNQFQLSQNSYQAVKAKAAQTHLPKKAIASKPRPEVSKALRKISSNGQNGKNHELDELNGGWDGADGFKEF
jgi:methyl-accepting chemotaxis protein